MQGAELVASVRWTAALGAALVALTWPWWPKTSKSRVPSPPVGWVALWALVASLLSWSYVKFFLHGGPRIIDATSYWLQARALSHGLVSWPALDPSSAVRGRFLLTRWPPWPPSVGVIFPPGYAAYLALWFLLGAPLAGGPFLAAALTLATAGVAWELSKDALVVRVVVVISALSAALRYHTADTMSHGLVATCVTGALWLGLRASRNEAWNSRPQSRPWDRPKLLLAAAGLLAGWAVAARPVTGGAFVSWAVAGLLLSGQRARRLAPWALAGLVPGVVGLLVEQRMVTGHWGQSSQFAYYALADGPIGCFRYGFGEGVGCIGEHGPYVASVLPHGYGLLAALDTTGKRLVVHVHDALNYGPFLLLTIVGAWWARREARWRWASLWPLVLVCVYVPFYFDGSYPGGGARMLVEAVAVEQILAALALSVVARSLVGRSAAGHGAVASALVIMLSGLSLYAADRHGLLERRDGGRPMFEPQVVRRSLGEEPSGLLFISTDHGFDLAYDPSCANPARCLVVARQRFDDHDRWLWTRMGKPTAWAYRFDPWAHRDRRPAVVAWNAQAEDEHRWRWELENEWPPLAVSSGYVIPNLMPRGTCASQGRVLGLTRAGHSRRAELTVEIPLPSAGSWKIVPRVVVQDAGELQAWVSDDHGQRLGEFGWELPWAREPKRGLLSGTGTHGQPGGKVEKGASGRVCMTLGGLEVEVTQAATGTIRFATTASWIGLDLVEIKK